MDKTIMNKKEAAEFLRLSIPTLERLMREKKIPYSKVNGRILFLAKDLIEWVKSKRVKSIGSDQMDNISTEKIQNLIEGASSEMSEYQKLMFIRELEKEIGRIEGKIKEGNKSKKKIKAQVQAFRPKDEGVYNRTPSDEIIGMAQDTIKNCESWIKEKKKELEKKEITKEKYATELKIQRTMIRKAKKTISEIKTKEEDKS